MKNKITLTVVLLLLNTIVFSQKKYELGKVTVEELKEKAHPIDTSAVAAVLFQVGRTYFYIWKCDFFSKIVFRTVFSKLPFTF